ncbi:hypothetical protein AB1K70_19625 [Bremerella sp. JC770]|uniref:hypothetical protein n=1 Tax=Bremerella sp. JC770 TaxID=3232137 RepID=UPI003457FB88
MTISKSLLAVGVAVSAILGGTVQAGEYTAKLLPGEEVHLKAASYEVSDVYNVSCSDEVLGCGNGCSTGSCGDLCQSCGSNECCCGPVWVGGVEATFLAPLRDGQTQWLYQDFPNAVSISGNSSDGNDGLVPAPRVWLGLVNCYGWGAQVRYWELNNDAQQNDPFAPLLPPTGDFFGVSSTSSIELYTLDAEVTKNFQWNCWDMQAGFGFRHASLDLSDTASVTSLVNRPGGGTNFMAASGTSGYDFEGNGITFALSGARPTCHGFELFWSARGSVLWGSNSAYSITTAQLSGPVGSAANTNAAIAGGDSDLFIGELQLGSQWTHRLQCANARFFFRGAFEYQYWSDGDTGTGATSLVGESGVGQLDIASQSGGNSSIDLVGFTLATGITY